MLALIDFRPPGMQPFGPEISNPVHWPTLNNAIRGTEQWLWLPKVPMRLH